MCVEPVQYGWVCVYAWARVLLHANLGSYGGRMRDEINQSAIQ